MRSISSGASSSRCRAAKVTFWNRRSEIIRLLVLMAVPRVQRVVQPKQQ
jgi:hypothetical protein